MTLHNGDTVNIESADDASEEKIRSNVHHTNVIKSTYKKIKTPMQRTMLIFTKEQKTKSLIILMT